MNIHERIERWKISHDYTIGDHDAAAIARYFTDSTPLTEEYLRERFGEPVTCRQTLRFCDTGLMPIDWYACKASCFGRLLHTVGQLNCLLYAAGVSE